MNAVMGFSIVVTVLVVHSVGLGEFLFAIGIGMLNGLVLVPIVLSLVRPAPYSSAKPPSRA
jgi:hypothetical protein